MEQNIQTSIITLIHTLRGQKVILDKDIAALYGIETRTLKQAVKRNKVRFPRDFLYVLTKKEVRELVSQNVIPSHKLLGGVTPFAFTEQGVAMLSGVLNSPKAIAVNIEIMRAFVQTRQILVNYDALVAAIKDIQQQQTDQGAVLDAHAEVLLDLIEKVEHIINPPASDWKDVGFIPPKN